MYWSGDFDSYERYNTVHVLTRTSVSACVGVFFFLCFFMPSVSRALCPSEIDVDPTTSPLLYSWTSDKLSKLIIPERILLEKIEWNRQGAEILHNWKVKGAKSGTDIKKAKDYFKKASNYGPALNNLGVIYWNGWDGLKNTEEAKKRFREAENQGYIPAQNNLGVVELWEAIGGPNTRKTENLIQGAINRIREAANNNYPPALNNLGLFYLNKQNYKEAISYFQRASELSYAPALYNLGVLYYRGYGDQRNDGKAVVDLYEKAARKGYVDAQYNLGLMYRDGVGVEKDLVNSFIWLGVAKEHGSDKAKEIQGMVEKIQGMVKKLLTGEQVSEATSCVKEISSKIHAVNPFTLYDDVAAAPELHELPELWKQKSWVSTYYEMAPE